MATPTYTLIDSTTLGSSASSVTFTGISATGKGDLVLVCDFVCSTANRINGNLNGDTGSNYSGVSMENDGGTTVSDLRTGAYFYAAAGRTTQATTIIQIMNYANTTQHKTILNRIDASVDYTAGMASRWANTAAVTSIALSTTNGTFSSGTFYLYQIVSE